MMPVLGGGVLFERILFNWSICQKSSRESPANCERSNLPLLKILRTGQHMVVFEPLTDIKIVHCRERFVRAHKYFEIILRYDVCTHGTHFSVDFYFPPGDMTVQNYTDHCCSNWQAAIVYYKSSFSQCTRTLQRYWCSVNRLILRQIALAEVVQSAQCRLHHVLSPTISRAGFAWMKSVKRHVNDNVGGSTGKSDNDTCRTDDQTTIIIGYLIIKFHAVFLII